MKVVIPYREIYKIFLSFQEQKKNMKEYKVKVYSDKTEWYNLQGQLHRDEGPAVECSNGNKSWYLEGKEYTEEGYWKELKKETCDGKVIEIEGKKYKLASF